MPKRKLESSKRHRSAFFKYSNQVLFERREKEFIKNKQEKMIIKLFILIQVEIIIKILNKNFSKKKIFFNI